MRTVGQLVTARFADAAFSGEGARLYGGRWNHKGVAMVYTSGTQSLAMLEILVQDEPLRARYVMIPAALPKAMKIERIAPDQLPADWRDLAAREQIENCTSQFSSVHGLVERGPETGNDATGVLEGVLPNPQNLPT